MDVLAAAVKAPYDAHLVYFIVLLENIVDFPWLAQQSPVTGFANRTVFVAQRNHRRESCASVRSSGVRIRNHATSTKHRIVPNRKRPFTIGPFSNAANTRITIAIAGSNAVRGRIRLLPGRQRLANTNRNKASTATRAVHAMAAPSIPRVLINHHSNPRYKGSSMRCSVAVRSGLPAPCKSVKGTSARLLTNTPTASHWSTRKLCCANSAPSQSFKPSCASATEHSMMGNSTKKRDLAHWRKSFAVRSRSCAKPVEKAGNMTAISAPGRSKDLVTTSKGVA